MKVSREQVRQHRARILATAARLFRERGFDGVSIAEVMKAAGLTHGGFYGHFDSKETLIKDALGFENLPVWRRDLENAAAADYADWYLSTRHRDNRGSGCAIAGLGSEAARAPSDVRMTLTSRIRRQIDRFSAASPGATPAQRRRAAIAAFAGMVGAVVLARVVDDQQFSEEILGAMRKAIEFD
jgi:TetR/AcrR family transcriptional regulator, transcriptional repressor for nem operon